MTVSELIEELKDYPKDVVVSIDNSHEGCLSFEMQPHQLVLTDDETYLMFTQDGTLTEIFNE